MQALLLQKAITKSADDSTQLPRTRCDADFGTLVSFIEQVRAKADRLKKDVFFFESTFKLRSVATRSGASGGDGGRGGDGGCGR